MKRRLSKNSRITVRCAAITLFILILVFLALYFMGQAYTAMEMTVFERSSEAFFISGWDEFSLFGKVYNLPIMTVSSKIYDFLSQYAPGIIKLHGFCINSAEELVVNLFDF